MKSILAVGVVLGLLLAPGSSKALVGGTPAKTGEYPATFQVDRGVDAGGRVTPTCTAARISSKHVLLAAHCLFKYVDGVQQALGLTFFFSYGVNAKKHGFLNIEAVYVPREALAFLNKYQGWKVPPGAEGTRDMEAAHDVAVIEMENPLPAGIAIGNLSSSEVAIGSAFQFGGYGCEKFPSPGQPPVNTNPRLKYATGTVTELSSLMAQGPTYKGKVVQSLCNGDSGGPVYMGKGPSPQIIGINNFHKTPESGDKVNSEINFSLTTKGSVLGQWVRNTIAGKVAPFED